eukprot:CAMPEP_0198539274 /NCGR_PEP_ID=MMETSP1462-20131121/48322_1 /TAXON_ID=1333877 /ORGANISM="Brandtodinium nutriculum, Strain RCC3387" /LENGTH=161 /DNA_ID=CAMNT_0044269323 /DNA_START=52 /DNA_END=535 /DNA_ORIENTATION=-
MGSFADRLKEYHRSLRPKRGDELSMKQVACFFGGLYAVIHLLQFFDLWTLLILATIGYVLYRQAQNTMANIQAASSAGEDQANAPPQAQVAAKPRKAGKKNAARPEGQAKSSYRRGRRGGLAAAPEAAAGPTGVPCPSRSGRSRLIADFGRRDAKRRMEFE